MNPHIQPLAPLIAGAKATKEKPKHGQDHAEHMDTGNSQQQTKSAKTHRVDQASTITPTHEVIPVEAGKPEEPTDDDQPKSIPKLTRVTSYLDRRYEFQLDIVGNEIFSRPKGSKAPFTILNRDNLLVELYNRGFEKFEAPFKALLRSDYVPKVNPLIEYFKNLPAWDQSKPDYIGQLGKYVKARNPEWFAGQYKKWLVRAVACAIGEIPFNKQCLVFSSTQNDGKTSFIRFHCPNLLQDYYTEHITLDGKTDSKIALCQNFLINFDELSALEGKLNMAKSYITEDRIKVRRPYAEKPTPDKRRASFFGTVNDPNFLTDPTGNVRWLIIEIEGIEHDNGGPAGYNRNIDMDQVWAQAYALLRSGFPYQMTSQELAQLERNNKGYRKPSMERDMITENVEPAQKGAPDAEFLSTTDIFLMLNEAYGGRLKSSYPSFGKELIALGFMNTKDRNPANRRDSFWGYWVKIVGDKLKMQNYPTTSTTITK